MRRISIESRKNWQSKVEEIGFNFHTLDSLYWDETAYYEFSMDEVDQIEKATNELWTMCLEAVQYVIDNKLYSKFHIPQWIVPLIESSWDNDAPAIYGRFDFSFKYGVPKLLEFNADTPTSLFESSVVQWYWLQDFDSSKDQFNSIHEKLIAYWKYLEEYLHDYPLHFSAIKDNTEDFTTTEYMRDCAIQAGYITKFIDIKDIGWDNDLQEFLDLENKTIKNIFKLYPWEWLIDEEFGQHLLTDRNQTFWVEPSWKMILSNKAILPILWQLFKYHDHLLESYFEEDQQMLGSIYVKKPLLSREGSNISIIKDGEPVAETDGEYGQEGYIYQEYCPLPTFGNKHPQVGSWIIGQESAGIGIRESETLITDNMSSFVPHLIV